MGESTIWNTAPTRRTRRTCSLTTAGFRIYGEVQSLILDNQLFIYLGNLTPPIFVSDRVHNVDTQGTAAGRVDFRGIWVSD